MDGHQVYSGGLVVGKVSTVGRDLAYPFPNFYTVSKSAKLGVIINIARESLNFEPPKFENTAIYPNSETNFLCSHDRTMSSSSLVKLGPRTPENCLAEMPHPRKIQQYLALASFDSLLYCKQVCK